MPLSARHSMSARTDNISLSIRTPSQSKMTSSNGTGSGIGVGPWLRRRTEAGDFAHEGVGGAREEERDRVGHRLDQLLDPEARLIGREVLQHVGMHQLLDPGMADPDAYPPVVGADHLVDRAQPVMPGAAA